MKAGLKRLDMSVIYLKTNSMSWLAISPADCRFKPSKTPGLSVFTDIKEVVLVTDDVTPAEGAD